MALPLIKDWLKLDRPVSSQVRLHGWEKDCPLRFAAPAGAHDAVEIAVIEAGTVQYAIAGEEVVVPAGHVMIVPRGVAHATTFLGAVRGFALWLGADFVTELADVMGPRPDTLAAPGLMRAECERVRTLLGVLVGEVRGEAPGHVRAAEALAESIVIEVLRKAPRPANGHAAHGAHDGHDAHARDARVVRAIEQMNACFAEPLGIDDLARTAHMSRFHFSRLFRDDTGQAPYQYLLRVRVAKAAELLRGGHHSVTEAAFASGFSDLSRFASMFKKQMGKRPSEMLRAARSA